jgi:isoleucyl-tRNA synthetase
LIKELEEKFGKDIKVISKFDPETIMGQKAINPINGNDSLIVYGHHINTEAGTGIVHIAGGHGEDDFIITNENDLPLLVVVDEAGLQINSGKYDGNLYFKNEDQIIEDLKLNDALLYHNVFTHSASID